MSGPLRSCLYVGNVRHRRFAPVEHHFRRPLFMFSIDLEEVESLFRIPLLWSTKTWSLFQFRRSDYLGPADRPLAECVRELVREKLGFAPAGPIRLLTQIRCLGVVFNPISLFYCYDVDNQLQAIVAEVTNTPWRERHCYVVPFSGDRRVAGYDNDKEFHVSPFMPMDMRYRWRVTEPDERLTVQLENRQGDAKVFDALLQLTRRELTPSGVARLALRFPLMPAQIVAAIYWQALRLWQKKVPYHPHPAADDAPLPTKPAADSLVP